MRRTLRVPPAVALACAGLAGLTGLTACSSDDAPPPPDPPATAAAPAWNPCSSLDRADVARLFGATYGVRTGTPDAPVCTFTPQTEGDPVVDVNYQLLDRTLAELLATFGDLEEQDRTTVLTPTVAGADDARLIVDTGGADGDTIAITGFVQTGELVQVVNVLDPAPYAAARLQRRTTALMADLAADAGSSGLTG